MNRMSAVLNRKKLALRKVLRRTFRPESGGANVLFVLGVQRSGTTMIMDCLNRSVELDVYGEGSAAMQNWRLRENARILELIEASKARAVIFKPLTESHRASEFLAAFPRARICWAFRRAEDRANSAVKKFGANNLELLSGFVKGEKLDTWQAQGMSESSIELLRRFDYSTMSPHSAAALFWFVRNSLLFEQGLDKDARVLPLAYEDIVRDPATTMAGLCKFAGISYSASLTAGIHSRSVRRDESRVDPEIAAMCESRYENLHAIQAERWSSQGLGDALA